MSESDNIIPPSVLLAPNVNIIGEGLDQGLNLGLFSTEAQQLALQTSRNLTLQAIARGALSGYIIAPQVIVEQGRNDVVTVDTLPEDTRSNIFLSPDKTEEELIASLYANPDGMGRAISSSAAAERFRAARLRESSPLRALVSTSRSDPSTWERVSGFLDRSRKDAYIATGENGRNRALSPLLSGIYTADRKKLEVALDTAVRQDGERLQDGQYWPTVVIGSGPSSSIFVSQRRERKPSEPILTIDDGDRLGGQFALARRPLFRLNSRNRPTTESSPTPLPGDRGNLNSLTPGVIEVSDLDATVYPTQNVLATACAMNTYLSSTVVSTGTRLAGVQPNRNPDKKGELLLVLERNGEMQEVTADNLIVGSGTGKEDYEFADKTTTTLIETERLAAEPRILTYDDFLAKVGDATKQFPLEAFKNKRVAVVGAGDSSKTVIETLLGLQVQVGDSVAQADQVEKVVWVGQASTTKEALCQNLRARYNLIALNAPRAGQSFESRIEIVAPKAVAIADAQDGTLSVITPQNTLANVDMVVVAKGYKNELQEILAGIATPAEIDGSEINDNPVAQEQLANVLMPGSYIRLSTAEGREAAVELLPARDGGTTLRFDINGTRFDRTYSADQISGQLMKILGGGKVISIEAINNGDFAIGGTNAVIAELGMSRESLREFIRKEQRRGNVVYGFSGDGLFDELSLGFSDNGSTAAVRSQLGRGGFFNNNFASSSSTTVTIDRYLGSYTNSRSTRLLSLPPAVETTGQDVDRIVRRLMRGEQEAIDPLIKPGFGISFENNSDPSNVIVVVGVENDEVRYVNRLNAARRNDGAVEILSMPRKNFAAFLTRQYAGFGAGQYSTSLRIVGDTATPKIGVSSEVQKTARGGSEIASFLTERTTDANTVLEYIKEERGIGNEVLVYDSSGDYFLQALLNPESDDITLNIQNGYDFDFFGARQTEELSIGNAFDEARSIAVDYDRIIFSLPPSESRDKATNSRYIELFRQNDIAEIGKVLQPGFGLCYEADDRQRSALFILKREGNRIEYLDTDTVADGLSQFVTVQSTVGEFLALIGDDIREDNADDYNFEVRIPKPPTVVPDPSAGEKPAQVTRELKSEPISIPASRLELSEQTFDENGDKTAIAKTVFGKNVYVIGPAAKLPLSRRESERLNGLGLRENAEAIFRYAPRNRKLAELLPSRSSTVPMLPETSPQIPIFPKAGKPSSVSSVVSTSRLVIQSASTQLPYDVDLQETTAFAAVAALQNRINLQKPTAAPVQQAGKTKSAAEQSYGVTVKAEGAEDGLTVITSGDGISEFSTKEISDALLADPLFLTAFGKLSQYAPGGYQKQLSFELTPNGVNPYTVTIQNVRKKPAKRA